MIPEIDSFEKKTNQHVKRGTEMAVPSCAALAQAEMQHQKLTSTSTFLSQHEDATSLMHSSACKSRSLYESKTEHNITCPSLLSINVRIK